MIIILTGVDGTGKSTVFDGLQQVIKHASFIREPYPGKDVIFRMVRRSVLETFVRFDDNVKVIYDRSTLLDDLVYESVLSGRESIFNQDLHLVANTLSKCHIIRLVCDPEVLSKRFTERGDEYISSGQLDRLSKKYDEVLDELSLKPYVIDTTSLTPQQVLDKVLEYIFKLQQEREGL